MLPDQRMSGWRYFPFAPQAQLEFGGIGESLALDGFDTGREPAIRIGHRDTDSLGAQIEAHKRAAQSPADSDGPSAVATAETSRATNDRDEHETGRPALSGENPADVPTRDARPAANSDARSDGQPSQQSALSAENLLLVSQAGASVTIK